MPLEDTTITQSTHTSDPAYQVHLCTVCHGIGKGHSCSTAHMPDISTRRQNNSHTPISSNHKIPSSHTHHNPQHILKHTKDSHPNIKIIHIQKKQSQNTAFYFGIRPAKKHTIHTIPDTHFKKNTHTHFIQSQDTLIPHTPHTIIHNIF